MATQQEFEPLSPAPADEPDDLYEDEPRRRPWGPIASVVLLLAVVFAGYQWHQASVRAQDLAGRLGALRAEAEQQRLRAEEAFQQSEGFQRRVAALTTEKDELTARLAAVEKSARRCAEPRRDARAESRATKGTTTRSGGSKGSPTKATLVVAKKPR